MAAGQHSIKVLTVCYSFSSQTRGLVQRLVAGLEQQGVQVDTERLQPAVPLKFPIGTVVHTVKMMLTTFIRQPIPIDPLSRGCFQEDYDLILLAGPTWSYNPSGPVLFLLKRDGSSLFNGKEVLPLISCRGYWRMHAWGLKRLLADCGARVSNVVVFSHPSKEPWRTIGVFMKLAGMTPEKSIIGKHYPRYGHSREQQEEAFRFGAMIGRSLLDKTPIADLDFQTDMALP